MYFRQAIITYIIEKINVTIDALLFFVKIVVFLRLSAKLSWYHMHGIWCAFLFQLFNLFGSFVHEVVGFCTVFRLVIRIITVKTSHW